MLILAPGSGAIALAIKHHRPKARVVAVDASAAALEVAKRNVLRYGLDVEWRHGRWFEPIAGERFDPIISNPPYVRPAIPTWGSFRFEPRGALVSGADGLDAIREMVRRAPAHLPPGGWLLVEHGAGQDVRCEPCSSRPGLKRATLARSRRYPASERGKAIKCRPWTSNSASRSRSPATRSCCS